MRYWKYKGYNADNDLVTGVAEGDKPATIILRLRQTGIQIYDMATISSAEYKRAVASEDKLDRLIRLRAKIGGDSGLDDKILEDFDNSVADETATTIIPPGPNDPAYKAYEILIMRWRRLAKAVVVIGSLGVVAAVIAAAVYCLY